MEFIKDNIKEGLICPCCQGPLSGELQCESCDKLFPLVHNIPILINNTRSIFTCEDFVEQKNTFFDISKQGKHRSFISKRLPRITSSRGQEKRFKDLKKVLLQFPHRPRVLVVGGSIIGEGMDELLACKGIEFVESDVSFGPRTQIILDAHDIPYADGTFDGVIAQAVLEHVVDPYRCASEMTRVLKSGGVVYSQIPFMQQVHGGEYDFTRFTLRGHQGLFKNFKEIVSGASSGSGTVLAWSYQYLLLGLFGYTPKLRYIVKAFARITGFWLKYFDYFESHNPYHADGASGTFFIGKKL